MTRAATAAKAGEFPGIEWARKAIEDGRYSEVGLARAIGLTDKRHLMRLIENIDHAQVGKVRRNQIESKLLGLMNAQSAAETKQAALGEVTIEDPLVEHLPYPDGDPIRWWRDVAMREWGWNLGDIAREVDYDQTVVSKVFSGKYEGSQARIVSRFAAARDRALGLSRGCVIRTRAARAIWEELEAAHGSPLFTAIVGEPGIGKTDALRRYAQSARLRDRRVLLITVTQTATVRTLCSEILTDLGGVPNGQTARMVDRIVAELKKEPRLIVLDEVNNLADSYRSASTILNTLRGINDLASTGLVLVGTQGLLTMLYAPARRDQMEMLLSRIGHETHLPSPSDGEIKAFVRAFFDDMDEAAWKAFWAGLNGGGRHRTKNSFRRAASWVRHVQEILDVNGIEGVDADVTRAGWERMVRN